MKPGKPTTFRCRKCKIKHVYGLYATAQIASGHSLIFTCPCGAKISLTRRTLAQDRERIAKEAP